MTAQYRKLIGRQIHFFHKSVLFIILQHFLQWLTAKTDIKGKANMKENAIENLLCHINLFPLFF